MRYGIKYDPRVSPNLQLCVEGVADIDLGPEFPGTGPLPGMTLTKTGTTLRYHVFSAWKGAERTGELSCSNPEPLCQEGPEPFVSFKLPSLRQPVLYFSNAGNAQDRPPDADLRFAASVLMDAMLDHTDRASRAIYNADALRADSERLGRVVAWLQRL